MQTATSSGLPSTHQLLRLQAYFFTFFVILFASPLALACTCSSSGIEPDEFLARYRVIFRGTVITTDQSGVARFKVKESLKGPRLKEIDVRYGMGTTCDTYFAVGQEAVVVA